MENTKNYIYIQERVPEHQQHEDVVLKTCMQFFANKEGQKELRLEAAKNLIGLLDEKIIAERIGLPLEIVKKLKESACPLLPKV